MRRTYDWWMPALDRAVVVVASAMRWSSRELEPSRRSMCKGDRVVRQSGINSTITGPDMSEMSTHFIRKQSNVRTRGVSKAGFGWPGSRPEIV